MRELFAVSDLSSRLLIAFSAAVSVPRRLDMAPLKKLPAAPSR
jgi:hypothetical protein